MRGFITAYELQSRIRELEQRFGDEELVLWLAYRLESEGGDSRDIV